MKYYLRYQDVINYVDAMEYLIKHFEEFPTKIPKGGPVPEISVAYFKSHRFVLTDEGEIVFGDGLVPGINAEDFNAYRSTFYLMEPQAEGGSL